MPARPSRLPAPRAASCCSSPGSTGDTPGGTVGKVEDVGSLPSGMEAVVIRGLHRATIGAGVPGTGDATWVQVEPSSDPSEPTERARELAREYRAVLENIVESRGVPQV